MQLRHAWQLCTHVVSASCTCCAAPWSLCNLACTPAHPPALPQDALVAIAIDLSTRSLADTVVAIQAVHGAHVACTPTPHAEQALSHAELLMGHTLRRVRLAVQLMCAQQYLSAACGNTMTSASMEHDSRDEQNISTSSCYDSAASQPCVDKGENMVKASMQNEPSHSRPASMQGEPDFLGEEVCSSWT